MKDYIIQIFDYKEDIESCMVYKRLIRTLLIKNCESETKALNKAKQILIDEGRFLDDIIDIMFNDVDKVYFDTRVYPLDNEGILF